VGNAKAGLVQFRTYKAVIIHGSVGQVGFQPAQVR
jgi:ribosomal protein L1